MRSLVRLHLGLVMALSPNVLAQEAPDDPLSPMARFYRGIAFRAQGRVVESNREFAIAGRLTPALRPETLLARALGLFELGQEAAAVDLLRLVLQLDPASESAIRARLLLRQKELLGLKRAWRIDAYAGFEWDDNVILASAENEAPPALQPADPTSAA